MHVLGTTLDILRKAGHENRECLVLWLGRREATEIPVVEAYRPEQVAAEDFFRLPRSSIADLLALLRDRNLMVAAQVHTHPEQAFHSVADDTWAIVRHVGALSLVLPYFARNTSVSSFLDDAAVFQLSAQNQWHEIPNNEVARHVRGVP